MKKFLLFLALPALLLSCKNEPKPVALESLKISKKQGADCDQPDTLRTHCAEVILSYPSVKEGSEALKKAVAEWETHFLVSVLASSDDSAAMAAMNIEGAVRSFFLMHKDWTTEAPDANAYYTAFISDTVLLNDGKLLTPKMEGHNYTGGAHGSQFSAVSTFDAATGRQLTWTDLVTDTTALLALAEKKFREVKADIFMPLDDGSEGFTFDNIFVFTLPANYGLTDRGVYFCYVPYEVTPYAYGSTDFVLTFAELGTIRKSPQ